MLSRVDIVSVNCPHTPATQKLLTRERLEMMQPSAYLVNTSRGEVVDEEALAELLASRHIAGAGLDVYADEPNITKALLDLPNVVLLPHIGSALEASRCLGGNRKAKSICLSSLPICPAFLLVCLHACLPACLPGSLAARLPGCLPPIPSTSLTAASACMVPITPVTGPRMPASEHPGACIASGMSGNTQR